MYPPIPSNPTLDGGFLICKKETGINTNYIHIALLVLSGGHLDEKKYTYCGNRTT